MQRREFLKKSAIAGASLSIESETEIFDRIYINQPNLLAHVLVLSTLGVSNEKIDPILHLLLVFYHCFTENERWQFPVVSEEELFAADNNTIAMLRFFDKEEPSDRAKYREMSILNYPEQNVYAYMVGYLKDNGFVEEKNEVDEYCLRSIKNVFDCFCRLRKDYSPH